MKEQYNYEEILNRLKKFCTYQERSIVDLKKKLEDLKIREDKQSLIDKLVEEGFLNEERFAIAFVRGKYKIKKWGRVKIIAELKKHQISNELIAKALNEIDEKEYLKNLEALILNKSAGKNMGEEAEKARLYRFLLSKGYEHDIIYKGIAS